MAKKRKSDTTPLDEVDRSLYTSFCSAANSLSQLYTQSMNQQRLSFQAGERHGLEKLHDWILKQEEDGSRVHTVEIVAYLQNELEHGLEEAPMSPRLGFQQQHTQNAMHSSNTNYLVSSSSFGPTTGGQGQRSAHSDHQTKNLVFSNALSSPVRRSLQQCHFSQGGFCASSGMPSGQGSRNNETVNHQMRDSNATCSNDLLMDMHADSPCRDSSC